MIWLEYQVVRLWDLKHLLGRLAGWVDASEERVHFPDHSVYMRYHGDDWPRCCLVAFGLFDQIILRSPY